VVVGLYGLDVWLLEDDLLGFFMLSLAPLPISSDVSEISISLESGYVWFLIHVGIAFFYAFKVIYLLSLFGMLVFS
jgi:hypothetical protein